MRKQTLEQFINKAVLKHGEKYDYSKAVYKNADTKLIIICPEHGEFIQTPAKHISNNGCRLCGVKKRVKASRMTQKQFIEKSKLKHNYIYD